MASGKTSFNNLPIPADGQRIEYSDGRYIIPDRPIIPFVEGDGTGRDIWKASRRVFDAAVQKAYGGKREVVWYEVYAGEKAHQMFQEWMPQDTVDAIKAFRVKTLIPKGGETVAVEFVADQSGIFEVETHESELELLQLEVR